MSPEEEEEVQIELAALERESLRNVVKVVRSKNLLHFQKKNLRTIGPLN
jgi:hypothetical protein